jgi:hypothetical protein
MPLLAELESDLVAGSINRPRLAALQADIVSVAFRGFQTKARHG